MWLHKETKKALPLRRLLMNGFDHKIVEPEPLQFACVVTHGLMLQKYEWVLALEHLASEEDAITLEKKLQQLLDENTI